MIKSSARSKRGEEKKARKETERKRKKEKEREREREREGEGIRAVHGTVYPEDDDIWKKFQILEDPFRRS